jgi:hypothetical protein
MTYPVDIVRDILPEDLAAYLRAHRWQEDTHAHPKATLWTFPSPSPDKADDEDADERSVEPIGMLIPKSASFSDYLTRVAQGLTQLELIEQRPWANIARDVLLVRSDVIRLQCEVLSQSSIPLDDGRLLVDYLFDMLTAAACSAVFPRAVVPPRRPVQALDYMRRIQLGHTERGSFIFTAISRVEPLNTPGAPGLEEGWDGPFPRKVTNTLVHALDAVTEATNEVYQRGSFDAFPELVRSGISANLCDALAGMVSNDQSARPVNISVAWASTFPNESRPERPSYRFDPDRAPILRQAAARLRAIEPIPDELVTGVVTRLSRGEQAEDGVVTVLTVIHGSVRNLQVPLPHADYRRAVEAHRDRLQVLFKANVQKRGRVWEATNVSEFRVVG